MNNKQPWYNRIEEWIMVVLLTIIVVILTFSVITRYIFRFTFSWAEELSRFLLVWAMCAGISWCGKSGDHLTVTAMANAFHKKSPKTESAIFLIGDLINIGFGVFMAWRLWIVMMTVKKTGQVFTSMPFLPKWLMYLAGVLAMAGMAVRIIQRLAENSLKNRKVKEAA
ncbi:MAG: TRAP transporter small permease [Solobacterium sp.]|nr:TRAP transporter small permease [Solobacterium sp.]